MPVLVNRFIRAFSNETELEIWVLPIDGFSLPEFQVEFCVEDPEDPMYYCYQVKLENVPFLERYITNPHGWNFESASYFVDTESAQ